MKNIDRIRNADVNDLVEILHEGPFDCANYCSEFGSGCLGTCTHDAGRDFIRDWLEEES